MAATIPGTPNAGGLAALRDRVTALGGTLHIGSRPGAGTRLAATIPLRAQVHYA